MREKIHSYLGFAKRGRFLLTGYNTCIYGLERRKIKLLILAEDVSENTRKKFEGMADTKHVPFRVYGTKEALSQITGEDDKGVYGITDENLACAIQKELGPLEQIKKKEVYSHVNKSI